MRRIHRIVALWSSAFVAFMALTGIILSLQPLLEGATGAPAHDLENVALLAARAHDHVDGLERLVRLASGRIVAYSADKGTNRALEIDPQSGQILGPYEPSALFSLITELHRSLLLGAAGRVASGITSVGLVALAASGISLLLVKLGGWRGILDRARGTATQRFHTKLARTAVVVLLLSAATGTYMSLGYFELIPSGGSDVFSFPPSSEGDQAAPIASLEALGAIPQPDLRELIFPVADDPSDVFTVTTSAGRSYVDQSTGAVLSFTPNDVWQQVYDVVYVLHTGSGLPLLALVLGVSAVAILALAGTGIAMWLRRPRPGMGLSRNAPHRIADTVVLVGSETGTTWGFAVTLHQALSAVGRRVHLAAMDDVRRDYPAARLLVVLTATYGDGAAPSSARKFRRRIQALRSRPGFAVLGFGDQGFPAFCAYAPVVESALRDRGLEPVLGTFGIDRRSSTQFGAWGRMLSEVLGTELELVHTPPLPRTRRLVLVERAVYGLEVQAPIAVLRFRQAEPGLIKGRLPHFEPGDLLGVVPPGDATPRYYSLATGTRDDVLEVCVRKLAGGLCSEHLHALLPGDTIDAFVRQNPDFRPSRNRRPLILIGAGAGIAPLAGMVRDNRRRPVHVFFGARHPHSDFLYEEEFAAALADGRLASLTTAFSRIVGGGYVQDRLLEQAPRITGLVARGAQVMVCGSREMAAGVREVMGTCLEPVGLSVERMKRTGRYLEDAY